MYQGNHITLGDEIGWSYFFTTQGWATERERERESELFQRTSIFGIIRDREREIEL